MSWNPRDTEGDERYFEDEPRRSTRVFDASLLGEPLSTISTREPVVFSPSSFVSEAMRSMQRERLGCVLVTEDGTRNTRLVGIFSERDVLLRIVDQGRNPASLPLSDVMTAEPETVTTVGRERGPEPVDGGLVNLSTRPAGAELLLRIADRVDTLLVELVLLGRR